MPRDPLILISDREPVAHFEHGHLHVTAGTLTFSTDNTVTPIPSGMVTAISLGPGTTTTHAAVAAATRNGCTIVWTAQDGTRNYASTPGTPSTTTNAERHATVWSNPERRLSAARRLWTIRFGDLVPDGSANALRGAEGARTRPLYKAAANQAGIKWDGRTTGPDWTSNDPANRALSSAATVLYATLTATLSATGFLLPLGFMHSGRPLAFVYDIADLFRFDTVVPAAFKAAEESPDDPERLARRLTIERIRDAGVARASIDAALDLLQGAA